MRSASGCAGRTWHETRDGFAEVCSTASADHGCLGRSPSYTMIMASTEFGEVTSPSSRGAACRRRCRRGATDPSEVMLAASKWYGERGADAHVTIYYFEQRDRPGRRVGIASPEALAARRQASLNQAKLALGGRIEDEKQMAKNLDPSRGLDRGRSRDDGTCPANWSRAGA